MALANDSILVTPGTGATVATHLVGGKEHQVTVRADQSGHIEGSKPTFWVQTGFNTIAQNAKGFDLWNGHASAIIRVGAIYLQKNMAAVTGIAQQYDLNRFTAAPTAGTLLTPNPLDTSFALAAGITAGRGQTITLGTLIMSRFYHSEETNVAAQMQEAMPYWPPGLAQLPLIGQDLTLLPSQGIAITEITASPLGTWNIMCFFAVEV